ncbi:MAG: hypothetical protein A3D64_01695 [Candidatus Wildermuthbacteria bacterium RIFCSPHIGHO2_02_FULL_49_9]|uniref:Ribbon-helix-helix protein CopG domain-containing protein n=2 Tax=Candidatus Wildermuthiibacteriota TaxID=1817923 RepID=A0A1G2QZV7_9BACT|nr:MAG: hypothetical protein A2672_02300 [Candidatus Wildermuthbacteria bacterium RIFCSPHIGHO2_01_FULL_49_22b]OHA70548.1 MAG: hypothetical protein A3D64_01695 [Candidatus Wildermuthbacteria bacterium RIFCSPHIGHO2_02_FULL_49_9]
MKRTQIQLEELVWEALRARSFQERRSIAEIIREMVRSQMEKRKARKPYSIRDFSFIGAGASRGKGAGAVSERHDEEFADSIP